ncbi:(2Fe-2S)-binding protein [Streptomyces sp. TLI_171]|uniref:(2Fe-2S)-binding protein n=1 Tax=Streptomyces sp. TLI_171 TaxID=1938859 RepID=UPI000C5FF2F3|nr:carbon-monoxide dehydrogenase small subunit [Streptomyces sp. TLI_171]
MTDELLNHPGALTGDVRPTASYTLRVNGVERPVSDAWIGESLLYVLRERLGLAGAKDGCEQGECGACSIQVDGQLVNGCLVPAALAADSEIATVEGLSGAGGASDVQQALADSGAVQCGYCTPGMAMAVHDLLQRNHRPSDVEARQALCGNLCRCTGYRGALAAVQAVADSREAALEAELDAAEQAAAEAPANAAAAPRATEQSFADLALAGELPLYADSELWHEADQLIPAQTQGEATRRTGGYAYPPTPPHGTPVPAGWDPTPAHGTAADGYGTPAHGTAADGYGTPAHGTPYLPTPPHGTPHDAGPFDGTVYATDGYGRPYPGYDATPAHGIRLPEDENA